MVRFGWNFVGANICTFLGLPQIFEAIPGFISDTAPCQKKPGRASKILGNPAVGADIGTCKFSAKSDNFVNSWAKQQGSGQRHREALYWKKAVPMSLLDETITKKADFHHKKEYNKCCSWHKNLQLWFSDHLKILKTVLWSKFWDQIRPRFW